MTSFGLTSLLARGVSRTGVSALHVLIADRGVSRAGAPAPHSRHLIVIGRSLFWLGGGIRQCRCQADYYAVGQGGFGAVLPGADDVNRERYA